MKKNKIKNGFLFNLLLITVFFNIWFPKAGIKLTGIPLTVGNVFFAITFLFWILKKVMNGRIIINKTSYIIFALIIYSFIKFMLIGNFTNNIGYIIPLVVYPLIFIIAYDIIDTKEKLEKIIKVICLGFFFTSIYALLQYIFGIEKICIPGLTVNLSDYITYGSKWYLQKNNNNSSGIGTKIISTFQNGNLYGVNTLIIYPIVYNFFKNKNKNFLMYFSLALFVICVFLSLSRSCWLGIVLFMLFGIFMESEKNKNSLYRKAIIILMCLILICVSFKYFPSIAARFSSMDKSSIISMSGRTDGLHDVLNSFSEYKHIFIWIIGSNGFIENAGLAYEMTPLAILVQIGVIGIILFYGILYKVWRYMDKKMWLQNSVKLSIFIWTIVGCIEGAFWLPPTALNIFLILALGLIDQKAICLRKGE